MEALLWHPRSKQGNAWQQQTRAARSQCITQSQDRSASQFLALATRLHRGDRLLDGLGELTRCISSIFGIFGCQHLTRSQFLPRSRKTPAWIQLGTPPANMPFLTRPYLAPPFGQAMASDVSPDLIASSERLFRSFFFSFQLSNGLHL